MRAPEDLGREELVELARAVRDLLYLDPESETFSPSLDTSDADLVSCVRWQLEIAGLAPDRLTEAGSYARETVLRGDRAISGRGR